MKKLLLLIGSAILVSILFSEQTVAADNRNNVAKTFDMSGLASDVHRKERINRGFERMIQLVTVLGQVDNFVSDRAKNFIRKLNAIYEVDDRDNVRRYRSQP